MQRLSGESQFDEYERRKFLAPRLAKYFEQLLQLGRGEHNRPFAKGNGGHDVIEAFPAKIASQDIAI